MFSVESVCVLCLSVSISPRLDFCSVLSQHMHVLHLWSSCSFTYTGSSLKITSRCFRYRTLHLVCGTNSPLIFASLVRQSPSLSPITHGSSSSSSLPSSRSPLASSLTRSVFHSELMTWLFGKSFPP